MKYSQLIALIDPHQPVESERYDDPVCGGDIGDFNSLFGLSYYGWSHEFSLRMTKHWVTSWICTDTRVGLAVYCWDCVPVAVSTQCARKSDEKISFLSKECADMVRDAIIKLMGDDEFDIALIDPDEEIHQRYLHVVNSNIDNNFTFTVIPQGEKQ